MTSITHAQSQHAMTSTCSSNNATVNKANGFVSLSSGSDASSASSSLESIVSPRSRRIRLKNLQAKMQKAATIELVHLDQAAELKEERRRWLELYKTMNHSSMTALILHQTSRLNVREHRNIIKSVKSKVRALKRKEKSFLLKSSVIRNKRRGLREVYKLEEQLLSAAINVKSARAVEIIVIE